MPAPAPADGRAVGAAVGLGGMGVVVGAGCVGTSVAAGSVAFAGSAVAWTVVAVGSGGMTVASRVAVAAGRGVFVGVAVTAGAAGPQAVSSGPTTSTMAISTQAVRKCVRWKMETPCQVKGYLFGILFSNP